MASASSDDPTFDGGIHILAVTGELDVSNVGGLHRQIVTALDTGPARIVVDLTGTTHMDSSGLAELLAAHQRALDAGGALALVITSPGIRRTLEIRGVDGLLTIAATREEALARLG